MNFLGLGPGELFLILLLALIVFGPGKLPEIGASVGKAINEFRRATSEVTREFTRELQASTPPQEPRRSEGPVVLGSPVVEPAEEAASPLAEKAAGPEPSPVDAKNQDA